MHPLLGADECVSDAARTYVCRNAGDVFRGLVAAEVRKIEEREMRSLASSNLAPQMMSRGRKADSASFVQNTQLAAFTHATLLRESDA